MKYASAPWLHPTHVATCTQYLADVLEKLARGWPQRQLEELLPPMWKAAREAAAQAHSTSATGT